MKLSAFSPLHPREALKRYRDGQLAGPALIRHFLFYPEWRVPVEPDGNGHYHFRLIQPTSPERSLWLFSDDDAMDTCEDNAGDGVLGDDYFTLPGFAALREASEDLERVNFNPFNDDTIYYRTRQMPMLRAWAATIDLEYALHDPARKEHLPALMKHYSNFEVLIRSRNLQDTFVLAPDTQRRSLLAIFTAVDSRDHFLKKYRRFLEQDLSQVYAQTFNGFDLFRQVRTMPIDGVVVNPGGFLPARAFGKSIADKILTA